MRRRQTLLLAAAIGLGASSLGGCAGLKPTVMRTRGPNGQPAYALTCVNASDCYAKAGDLCGARGFQVTMSGIYSSGLVTGSLSSYVGSA